MRGMNLMIKNTLGFDPEEFLAKAQEMMKTHGEFLSGLTGQLNTSTENQAVILDRIGRILENQKELFDRCDNIERSIVQLRNTADEALTLYNEEHDHARKDRHEHQRGNGGQPQPSQDNGHEINGSHFDGA